jgi:hypothetical protein
MSRLHHRINEARKGSCIHLRSTTITHTMSHIYRHPESVSRQQPKIWKLCQYCQVHTRTCLPIPIGKSSEPPKSSISTPTPHHHHALTQHTQHNGLTNTPRPLRQEALSFLQHRRRARTVRSFRPSQSSEQYLSTSSTHPSYTLSNTPTAQHVTPVPSKSSAHTTRNRKPHGPATHTAGRGKTSS